MDRDEVFERVSQVIARVFKVEARQITDTTRAADVPGWDSLNHLILLTGLEKKFDIELPMKEAYVAQNVGELVALVQKTVAADDPGAA